MTLPLTARVGDDHQTRKVDGLSFRKNAVGGVESIDARVILPLDRVDQIRHFQTVTIYDGRTAEVVASGSLVDLGRGASSDGQRWALSAQGPALHAQDYERPLIYVDVTLSDGWRQVNKMNRGIQWSQSTNPADNSDTASEALIWHFPEGTTFAVNDTGTLRCTRLREIGQELGRISCKARAGASDGGNYRMRLWTSENPSNDTSGSATYTHDTSTTAQQSVALRITADFTDGRNVVDFRAEALTAGKPANDNKWFAVYDWVLRARLLDATGATITAASSYNNDYILAHEVVNDLLGRMLPEFDGAGAYVDTSATHQIDALAYPDGVHAAQVLDDLMLLEPTHRWWVTNSGQFRWEPWPTTVRYEATLEDGGDFPASAQTLYNEVTVRFRDRRGRTRAVTRTASGVGVDDLYLAPAGKTRRKVLDVGDEVGSQNGAIRVAENFLRDHAAPANTGTLNVARPIKDLQTGRMVDPWEIEPGNLIRVQGVESYADALNASSSDGRTVFRIWALTYNSDTNTANLELDTLPRNVYGALTRILKKRNRKR